MTGRLNLADVAAAVLEETAEGGYRVRPGARRMITREHRCRLGHLQAVVVITVDGPAVLWRPAAEGRKARGVWAEAWTWELPATIDVTCHCRAAAAIRWADAIN